MSADDNREGALLYKGLLLMSRAGVDNNADKATRCFVKACETTDPIVKAEACYERGKLFFHHNGN